ncbi:hypothetical protein CEXT_607891 [Caerostris extrusa]|uniref:Uncharacterized protein n=1 Tax=Caerostris extrusa TaxID=172846 RepID=A0AAV4MYT3_CAEEX|nr:hypothetical protein CEXT_607891 [Caerostris extrusa]
MENNYYAKNNTTYRVDGDTRVSLIFLYMQISDLHFVTSPPGQLIHPATPPRSSLFDFVSAFCFVNLSRENPHSQNNFCKDSTYTPTSITCIFMPSVL